MATIVATRVNLSTNPFFAASVANWLTGTGTVTWDATVFEPGISDHSMKVVRNSGQTYGTQRRLDLYDGVVKASQVYTVMVRMLIPSGNTETAGIRTGGSVVAPGDTNTTVRGDWVTVRRVFTTDPTVTSIAIYIKPGGDLPVNVSQIFITEGDYSGPIFTGATPRSVDPATGQSLVNTWQGTANLSASVQTAYAQDYASPTYVARRRSGWRYFATRLNGDGTETLLDPDLPLEDVSIEDVLSGHNALGGTISPVYSRLLGPDGNPLLQEYSTALYGEIDGDIRGGGILVTSGFDGPEWKVETVGFTGYAMDMPYVGNGYKGIKVDPIDVMRTIWNHIQNQPGGDIGLEFDDTDTNGEVSIGTELKQVEFDTKSGPVSFESGPYKLNFYTNHDLAGDIDDLAADTPFDYHERHYWDANGNLRHHVDIGYPSLGRKRDDLRFVYGVNIFDPVQIERDGTMYASGTMVLGAGEGASMIKSIKEPPVRPGGRLRRVAVVVDDSIKSLKRANDRADRENQWRAQLDDIDSVAVKDHPNARLGAAKVGDQIRIDGQGDWLGISMWVRIMAITLSPESGMAEYSITRTDKLTS